jgi:hypothetical protein
VQRPQHAPGGNKVSQEYDEYEIGTVRRGPGLQENRVEGVGDLAKRMMAMLGMQTGMGVPKGGMHKADQGLKVQP